MKMQPLLRVGLAALALGLGHAGAAQGYPDKPIQLIVPYAVGGTTDLLGRIVANALGANLKQPIVVENRPGAGGIVGSAYAAKQKADGYTLVMDVESSHAVNPNVRQKVPYDPVKDFAGISNIAIVPNVLVVNPKLPVDSVKAFAELLKARPGGYTYGSSGVGGLSNMNGELFASVTQTRLLHVPYKGLGPALTDLVSGQIQAVFDNVPSSASLIAAGRVKPLAVAAPKRLALLPDVPTYAEAGLPQMNNPSWLGIAAPAGTPNEVLDTLNTALKQVLADPQVAASIEKLGAIPDYMPRSAFDKLVVDENRRWQGIVKEIGFEKLP